MDRNNTRARKQMCMFLLLVILTGLMIGMITGCRLERGRDDSREAAAGADMVALWPDAGGGESKERIRVGVVEEAEFQGNTFFNRQMRSVLAQAEKELGAEVFCLTSGSQEDYCRNLEILAEEQCGIILVSGPEMGAEARDLALSRPNIRFVFVDDVGNGDLENGVCLAFDHTAGAYLAGVAAGMMTRTGYAGLAAEGGWEAAGSAEYAYLAGVLDGNPDAVILRLNESMDFSLIRDQVDVVFFAGGKDGVSLLDSCCQAGIWVIGRQENVKQEQEKSCLAMISGYPGEAVFHVLKDWTAGKWESGVITSGISNGGIDFQMNSGIFPEAERNAVLAVKEKLKAGQLPIPSTREELEAAYGENLQGTWRD